MQSQIIFLYVCATCFVSVLSECTHSWPLCHFAQDYICGWTHTDGWSVYRFHKEDFNTNYYLGLNENHNGSDRFESETVCANFPDVYCMQFRYRFEQNDVLNLSVIVKTSDQEERVVWRMSSSTNSSVWDHATAPVTSRAEFSIVFEATGPPEGRVDIDTIGDDDSLDRCLTEPPAASPFPGSSTSEPPSTSANTLTSTPTSGTPRQESTGSQIVVVAVAAFQVLVEAVRVAL